VEFPGPPPGGGVIIYTCEKTLSALIEKITIRAPLKTSEKICYYHWHETAWIL